MHGVFTDQTFWEQVVAGLAGQHVFARDMPGNGESESTGRHSALDDQVRAVERAQEEIGSSVVVGHSWGRMVGRRLASRRPCVVRLRLPRRASGRGRPVLGTTSKRCEVPSSSSAASRSLRTSRPRVAIDPPCVKRLPSVPFLPMPDPSLPSLSTSESGAGVRARPLDTLGTGGSIPPVPTTWRTPDLSSSYIFRSADR